MLVETDPLSTYELLTNFELKKRWQKNEKEFQYREDRVTRAAPRHICVFDGGKADFESVTNNFGKDNLVYGEKLITFPFAKDLTFYFILGSEKAGTKIRIEVHYRRLPVIGWLPEPVIRVGIRKIIQQLVDQYPGKTMEPSARVLA